MRPLILGFCTLLCITALGEGYISSIQLPGGDIKKIRDEETANALTNYASRSEIAPITNSYDSVSNAAMNAVQPEMLPSLAGYSINRCHTNIEIIGDAPVEVGYRVHRDFITHKTSFSGWWVGLSADFTNSIPTRAQIYESVRNLAPDFTNASKSYALNELCTYNGVVYRCKSAYMATAVSDPPDEDPTRWEAKKVSEIFLPLTGGRMTDSLYIGTDGEMGIDAGGKPFLADVGLAVNASFADIIETANGNSTAYAKASDIPAAQKQSDWLQTDSEALDFIKNKPSIPNEPGNYYNVSNAAMTAVQPNTLEQQKFREWFHGGEVNSWSDVTEVEGERFGDVVLYYGAYESNTGYNGTIKLSPYQNGKNGQEAVGISSVAIGTKGTAKGNPTNIIMPSTIKSIGRYSFASCPNLRMVKSYGAEEIGDGAFYNCTMLDSIAFPYARSIGNSAFENSRISYLALPLVQNLGTRCFAATDGSAGAYLKSVNLPFVKNIGTSAFENQNNLTSAYFKAESSVGSFAFANCQNLEHLALSNAVSIGQGAFSNCYKLTSVMLPSAESIGRDAFAFCGTNGSLTLNLPAAKTLYRITSNALGAISLDTIQEIPSHCFADAPFLKSASFNEATVIGEDAFFNCSKLELVDGQSVTNIKSRAFGNCRLLSSNMHVTNAVIIGSGAFSNSALVSVEFPYARRVDDRAFMDNIILQNLSLPIATQVGDDIVKWCPALQRLSMPSLQELIDSQFNSLPAQEVSFLSVTNVGAAALGGAKIYEVSMPVAINIGDAAFDSCSWMTNASFSSAKYIGNGAFVHCEAMVSIDIPNVTNIQDHAFSYCSSLDSLYLPRVTHVGAEAFSRCQGLRYVNFGGTSRAAPSLGQYAFYNVPTTCKIIVPSARIDQWKSAAGWSDLVEAGYEFIKFSEWTE